MKDEQSIYEEVGKRCSSYQLKDCDTFTDSMCGCGTASCLSCTHFTKGSYCELDLFDKIKNNL